MDSPFNNYASETIRIGRVKLWCQTSKIRVDEMEGWLRYPHFDSRRGFWHILQFSTDSCTKNPAFWPWVIRLKLKKTKGFDFQEFLEIWSKSLFFSKMKLTPSVSFWIFWSKISSFLLFLLFGGKTVIEPAAHPPEDEKTFLTI